MKEKLNSIRQSALEQINQRDTDNAKLEEIRVKYLGKKGELTAVLRGMGQLAPEERPVIGQTANEVREDIEKAIAEKKQSLAAAALELKLKDEKLDVTVPGKKKQNRAYSSAHTCAA